MKLPSIKRQELLYCISGAALAVVLFFTVLAKRYEGHLGHQSEKLAMATVKTMAMNDVVKDMRGLVGRFNATGSGAGMGAREVILASLDEMKQRLRASRLNVSGFNEAEGRLSINVEIEAPLGDYEAFLRNVHYLESMSAPWFTLQKVVVAEDVAGFKVRLRGTAMMPSDNGAGQ